MKKFLVHFFLITVVSNYANANYSDSLNRYYQITHKAVVSICNGKYDQAIAYYDSAFYYVNTPFFIDINNAIFAQVSSDHADTSKVISFLKRIQMKGICIHDYYRNRERFKPYLELISEEECSQVIDTINKLAIDSAIVNDQRPRNYSLQKYGDVYHPSVMDEIKRVDSIDYLVIEQIFRSAEAQNISLESLIGMDAIYSTNVILLHYSAYRNYDKILLERLAQKGILDARYTAQMIDDNIWGDDLNRDFGTHLIVHNGTIAFVLIPSTDKILELNKNRARLFLPDVIEEGKIRAFAAYNYRYGFNYGVNATIGLDDSQLEQYKIKLGENFKIIKYNGRTDFNFGREL